MTHSNVSFKKSERICNKKAFEFLFSQGKHIFNYPLKIIYARESVNGKSLTQVAFGVSKKNFKTAVLRNRVKRLLREVYRRHKIQQIDGINQYLMIIYISKNIEKQEDIQKSFLKALNQISSHIEKNY